MIQHAPTDKPVESGAESVADHEQVIRDRARELWEEEGRPEGRDEEYWRRAANELMSGDSEPAENSSVVIANPIPTEDDVSTLIRMVEAIGERVRTDQATIQALQLRNAAAEMRAEAAEQLLRKLYIAVRRQLDIAQTAQSATNEPSSDSQSGFPMPHLPAGAQSRPGAPVA